MQTVASVVGGRTLSGHQTVRSVNPADLSDVVAEAPLGDAATFVDACRAASEAQRGVGRRAGPRPRTRDRSRSDGSWRQQGGACAPRHRARSASRTPRRSARCRRSSTPATSSSARGAGCTGRRCRPRCPTSSCSRSGAGRHRGDHHGGQLPGRRAVLVPRAGAAVRQRGGLEAGRVRRRLGRGAVRAVPARRPARGRARPGACRRADTFAGLEQALDAGPRRQGRLHRLERVGRRIGELCGRHLQSPVPRARRQEPAGGHAGRRPRPRRRGRAVHRVRHGRAALHVAGHGDRPRVGARGVPPPLRRRRPRRP